jgi:8-oxo-dGTP pyrophosphatase MutT (NUDIX family)
MPLFDLSEDEIIHRLANSRKTYRPSETGLDDFLKSGVFSEPPRLAAVLIPFARIEDRWNILFTRRNNDLPEHSGQVAFPGGRADVGEASPEETALRESYEEIGLKPSSVHILGRMKSFLTITNYKVKPVVGSIPWPFPVRLARVEVSRVFTIPFDWLADPSNHEVQQRRLPEPHHPIPVIYFKPYDGEVLWGVSAYIVINLLEILVGKNYSDQSSAQVII